MKMTDASGYITDDAVREAYDRIITRNHFTHAERTAEAFLRLVERYAARGVRLIPKRTVR